MGDVLLDPLLRRLQGRGSRSGPVEPDRPGEGDARCGRGPQDPGGAQAGGDRNEVIEQAARPRE